MPPEGRVGSRMAVAVRPASHRHQRIRLPWQFMADRVPFEVAFPGHPMLVGGPEPSAEPDGKNTMMNRGHTRKLTWLGRSALTISEPVTTSLSIPAALELARHAERDATRLGTRFGGGRAPGPIVGIRALGDPHAGQRQVSSVRFRSGLTVIHKPRPVGPELIWNRVVRWFGARADVGPFLMPAVVPRARYGWVEFLRERRPASDRQARAFHRRAGTLLALLDVLEVRDVHADNLLAVGEHPVLVDAETIAHPRFSAFRRSPSLALTGFLPGLDLRDDHAGLSAGLRYPTIRPIHYQEELIAGYRDGYAVLQRHGGALLRADGPLRGLADTPIRVILRPTAWYRKALRRPGWFRTEMAPLPIPRAGHPAVEALERDTMARGDVPVFHSLGDGTDLLSGGRIVARSCFRESGLAAVANRLGRLSSADERRGVEILTGVLALDGLRSDPGTADRDRSDRRSRSRQRGKR